MRVTYNPLVFEQRTTEAARAIIVTPEGDRSTDDRWEQETPYVAGLIGEKLALKPGELVLDYGCGIGRISKALIERFDVRVLGVDISQNMRGLAPGYVGSQSFSVVSKELFRDMVQKGLRLDAAISVWVIQHCVAPQEDIGLIRDGVRSGGRVFVLNNFERAVPTLEASWVNDGISVRDLLNDSFTPVQSALPDPRHVGSWLSERAFWAFYTND
jgi:SAM-dependent methyltransferase